MSMDKREALLDAAERAILAEGFAGASTRRIAQEAGVPLSLVHYHFGGKEGLLAALVERTRQRNRSIAQITNQPLESPAERTTTALRSARAAISGGEAGFRLIVEMTVAALHNARLRTEVQRLYADTTAALDRSVTHFQAESGREPLTGPRTSATASLLLAAGFGLALQRMLGVEQGTIDEAFDLLGTLLFGCPDRS